MMTKPTDAEQTGGEPADAAKSGSSLSYKQMVAFKIGARARKFAVEGCPIEGYDYLYGCIADAKETDPPLYALLQIEAEKFDRRIAAMEE